MAQPKAWQGLLFGALGGAAGTLAMRYYWQAASALLGHDPRQDTSPGPPHTLDDIALVGQQHRDDETTTAAMGRIAYQAVMDSAPTPEVKQVLSYGVHWGYGIGQGALYGLLRRQEHGADLAGGALFGALLWLLGDELVGPLLGLEQGPTSYPLEQHGHRLMAHLVYGITAALTTQTLGQLA